MILNGMPALRPMLPADVDAATEMILGNDWGVRREWLALAATQPACVPMVADEDGRIVGTGVGTTNGPAGWIGTIFIEPAWRGQGLGRAITQAIIDRLESAGCRTLVLVATAEGRRLYERMGFEVQTRYRILEATGLPSPGGVTTERPGGSVRAFRAEDLDAMLAIDRDGTGEDRAHVLRRLATPETARVATGPDGAIEGFVIRAPWGGGATVARTIGAAQDLIVARRLTAGPGGRVRVGLLEENADGLARLAELGFRDQWSAPRMIRGAPLAWHPERIWGQFNHAMG
jgi:GNAT superfamily N-acetyltransferase